MIDQRRKEDFGKVAGLIWRNPLKYDERTVFFSDYFLQLREDDRCTHTKARMLLAQGCIEPTLSDTYHIHPLKQNKKHYIVSVSHDEYHCNCQGFELRNKCSHGEAVRAYRMVNK